MKKNIYDTILKTCCLYFCTGFCGVVTAADALREVIFYSSILKKKVHDAALGAFRYTTETAEQKKQRKTLEHDELARKKKMNYKKGLIGLKSQFDNYIECIDQYGKKKKSTGEAWKESVAYEKEIKNNIFYLLHDLPATNTAQKKCLQELREISEVGLLFDLVFAKKHIKLLSDSLTFLGIERELTDDFVTPLDDFMKQKKSIEGQISIIENIKDNVVKKTAVEMVMAYFAEKRALEDKAELPISDSLVRVGIGISIGELRVEDKEGIRSYIIENFGKVSQRELLSWNLLGGGNILEGLCSCAGHYKKPLEQFMNKKTALTQNEAKMKEELNIKVALTEKICIFLSNAQDKNSSNVSQETTVAVDKVTKNSMQFFFDAALKIPQHFDKPKDDDLQAEVVKAQEKLIKEEITSPEKQRHIKELIYAYHDYEKQKDLINRKFGKVGINEHDFLKKLGVTTMNPSTIHIERSNLWKNSGIDKVALPDKYKYVAAQSKSDVDFIREIYKRGWSLDLRSKVEPTPTILPVIGQEQVALSASEEKPVTSTPVTTVANVNTAAVNVPLVAKIEVESPIKIDKIDYAMPIIESYKESIIPAGTTNKMNASPTTDLTQRVTIPVGGTTKKSMQDFFNDAFKIEQYFYLPQSEYAQSTVVGRQEQSIEQEIASPEERKRIKELIYAYHKYKSTNLINFDFAVGSKIGHENRSAFWGKKGVKSFELPNKYQDVADASQSDIEFIKKIYEKGWSFDLPSKTEAKLVATISTATTITPDTAVPVAGTAVPATAAVITTAKTTVMPTSPATTSNPLIITDKPTPSNPSTTKESISPAKVTPVVSASSWRSWAYTPVKLLGNAVSGAWNAVKSVFSSVRHFFRFY